MELRWERDKGKMLIGCCGMMVFYSAVHPVGDAFRVLHDKSKVVRSITKERTPGPPIDPRPFPKGKWVITSVEKWEAQNAKFYGDWNIRTNAHQSLGVWALDPAGGYDKPLDRVTEDYGYSLHYSIYKTSLGCGISNNKALVNEFAAQIKAAIDNGDRVSLEVA